MTEQTTEHTLSVGPSLPRPALRGRGRFAASLTIAIAAHVGALYGALGLKPHMFGAEGRQFDAIEVTLVEGTALESATPATMTTAAISPATVQATIGEVALEVPLTVTAASAPRPAEAPRDEPPPAGEGPGEVITAALPLLQLRTEAPAVAVPPAQATPVPPMQAAGGVTARSASLAPSSDAAAGAPPGIINAYRSAVASALTKTKPPQGLGRGGTARVVFTIAASGTVESAEVQSTSGDRTQDQMAIAAVRATRFPRPDPQLTAGQRTFPVSYRFLSARQ